MSISAPLDEVFTVLVTSGRGFTVTGYFFGLVFHQFEILAIKPAEIQSQ